MIILLLVFTSFFISSLGYHNPHFIGNRTTIVHLFEWKWKDIAQECEQFLGPNGYGGVQLSPVNENAVISGRPWFERYQPISYKLTTRSGNRDELANMIRRCNSAGVRIYVDAVVNHMAADAPAIFGTGDSTANPGNNNFPGVPYTKDDFHKACGIQNYQNPFEVRNCELSGLKDLDQSKSHVRQEILKFLNELVDLGVAGFRMDAAKHMWPEDLEVIYGQTKNLNRNFNFPNNARPFIYQEVIDLGGEAIKKSDYKNLGYVTEFTYSSEIGRAYRGGNQLKWLKNWGEEWNMLPSSSAFVFIDNHDNQRGHGAGGATILTYNDDKIYKIASTFMLAHPYGLTRVMSSFNFTNPSHGPPMDSKENIKSPTFNANGLCSEKSGWVCEHRWKEIVRMVQFRNSVKGTNLSNWWDNGNNQIAFSRGNKGFVVINMETAELNQNLQTSLPRGNYCNIFEGGKVGNKCTGSSFTVGNHGKVNISVAGKHAVVLLKEHKL